MAGASIWTEERSARLTQLWLDGVSGELIARDMDEPGFHPTRCSILGKVHRLGLHRELGIGLTQLPQIRGGDKKPRQRPIRTERIKRQNIPAHRKIPVIGRPSLPPPRKPTIDKAVTIADLKALHCRWIVSEVDGLNTLYCGDGKIPGISYCPYHAQFVYSRTPEQKHIPKNGAITAHLVT